MTTGDQGLTSKLLDEVTQAATRRQRSIQFAGFLTREDEDAVYVADTVGTWIIPKTSLTFLEDWEGAALCAPEDMRATGRAVRVGVQEGATVHEIRPWKMEAPMEERFHRDVRRLAESIFTLGGAPLPGGDRSAVGERQLAELEQALSRQLGWNPNVPCNDPRARPGGGGITASASHTIVVNDGYCDADCPF
jgi:hypothetical protein